MNKTLAFDDIVLAKKKYRDKHTNFVGYAVAKSYIHNYQEPIIRLQGSLPFTPALSTGAIPVYDFWLSSLEEVEIE